MHGAGLDQAASMDRIYRYQRHIYDLTRKPYLLGRGRLLQGLDVPDDGTVLEMACGTGRNLIRAARAYPRARLYGFDISDEMLSTAAAAIWRQDLNRRITLAHADAAGFDGEAVFAQPVFDRIMISYALSMIPQWREVLERALSSLAPGGSLHVVDFGIQDGLPVWFRRALNAWLARFSVTPRSDLLPVLENLTRQSGARLHFEALHGGYASYAVIRR